MTERGNGLFLQKIYAEGFEGDNLRAGEWLAGRHARSLPHVGRGYSEGSPTTPTPDVDDRRAISSTVSERDRRALLYQT